jgi:hypothetical protein
MVFPLQSYAGRSAGYQGTSGEPMSSIPVSARSTSWLGGHVDLNDHIVEVVCIPVITAPERNCLARVARDTNADQIVIADNPVGRIEFDPAGAG